MFQIDDGRLMNQLTVWAPDPATRKKILVAIFQRGAADGLNVVVPHGEQAYYRLRPTIAIPRARN